MKSYRKPSRLNTYLADLTNFKDTGQRSAALLDAGEIARDLQIENDAITPNSVDEDDGIFIQEPWLEK